jgi:dUTP pyrophosphatase
MACKGNCECKKESKETLTYNQPVLEIVPMEHMFKLPTYAHEGDSGMDVYAADDEIIHGGIVTKVRTGICLNIPDGYEIQVRSRSGLAKLGIVVANSPGTVDSCYTGEVCVLLTNINSPIDEQGRKIRHTYKIQKGDRIAQLVFAQVPKVQVTVAKVLKETERGADGFGSSGV